MKLNVWALLCGIGSGIMAAMIVTAVYETFWGPKIRKKINISKVEQSLLRSPTDPTEEDKMLIKELLEAIHFPT